MTDSLSMRAPAKLNLALSVGAPEPSGMHPISSWMVTIDLFDELTLHRLPQDRLSRYAILWHKEAKRPSEIDWPLRADLAVRAHHAVEEQVGRRLPLQMKLEKRIPVGAGLGGGSSNAAAMLRGLNQLFELGLSDAKLASVAARMGSDVPFFIRGGSAIVAGFGEALAPATHRDIHATLVLPDLACSTRDVYRAYDALGARHLRGDDIVALPQTASPLPDILFNDLADAAVAVAPTLREMMARGRELAERPAHLTGSGSAFFFLCDDPLHAEALAAAIESRLDLRALPVKTISGD
jgi:4-diphosphocytidyl-2-C-methyl-D-erythritol kinase